MIDSASYFGDVTKIGKVAFYTLMASVLVVYSLIGLAARLLRYLHSEPVDHGDNEADSGVEDLQGGREGAPNPSYRPDPCRWRRYDVLLGLNPWEAEACCPVLSMLMGCIIGFERRRADAPPACERWRWCAWARASSRSTRCSPSSTARWAGTPRA